MNLKRKFAIWAMAGSLGLGSLVATVPSYADYGHYHHHWPHHYYPSYHHHHYHGDDGAAIALGVVGAAVVGGIIASSMSEESDGTCRQVYYTRDCGYDNDGDRECFDVKHVRYIAC